MSIVAPTPHFGAAHQELAFLRVADSQTMVATMQEWYAVEYKVQPASRWDWPVAVVFCMSDSGGNQDQTRLGQGGLTLPIDAQSACSRWGINVGVAHSVVDMVAHDGHGEIVEWGGQGNGDDLFIHIIVLPSEFVSMVRSTREPEEKLTWILQMRGVSQIAHRRVPRFAVQCGGGRWCAGSRVLIRTSAAEFSKHQQQPHDGARSYRCSIGEISTETEEPLQGVESRQGKER